MKLLLVLLLLVGTACSDTNLDSSKPNFVLFLTDDQDQMLGGSFPLLPGQKGTPMAKTQELLVEEGMVATNFFIHTPICCPSRSELLTGQYFHNIKAKHGIRGADWRNKTKNSTVLTKGRDTICMHVNETLVSNFSFAKSLSEEGGYKVGMFGKYLNQFPSYVPQGFDAWFVNGGGDYMNPTFEVSNVPGVPDGVLNTSGLNYSTSLIGNTSITWIKEVAGKFPFFAYIAPKAAHEPFVPAPWYLETWSDEWPLHEPRPVNYNCSEAVRADHPGVIATQNYISQRAGKVITDVYKNRWRTLLSVDDLISDVIQLTKTLGVYSNTYFFFTSDHGFQLGQFNILMDKRHVYDWNTRIPLVIAGPGITKGSEFPYLGTQVDLAPTFLELAGVKVPARMDGKSLVPLLFKAVNNYDSFESIKRVLTQSLPSFIRPSLHSRDTVFIEYYFNSENYKCVDMCPDVPISPSKDTSCGNFVNASDCWCDVHKKPDITGCYPVESTANNFIALRRKNENEDILYVEYMTGDQSIENINFERVDFVEYYNVSKDPWMIDNLYYKLSKSRVESLHAEVHKWFQCKGEDCG